MSLADGEYLSLCAHIMQYSGEKDDRTKTGTLSHFGAMLRFDLAEEFPIITTKKIHFKSIVTELLWFLRGDTNIKFLNDNGCAIWNSWADEHGDIGFMYGAQWRNWCDASGDDGYGIDQIAELVTELKNNPDSRRMLVNSWNTSYLPTDKVSPQQNVRDGLMALAPCHHSFQCYVIDGKLSLMVNQRSADVFLGVPFNITSYALLANMLAQVCNLELGELIWVGGDCHIYKNHIEQVNEQMGRYMDNKEHAAPKLWLNPNIDNIDDFDFADIELVGYTSESKISGVVAV